MDPAEIGLFRKFFIKEGGTEIFYKNPPVKIPTRTAVGNSEK